MAAKHAIMGAFGFASILFSLMPVALACHSVKSASHSAQFPFGFPPTEQACPLPVDDNKATWPSPTFPWTHPPECEHSTDQTTKYCAYTHSGHGSRGWSLITTPETAAESVALLSKPLNASNPRRSLDAPYKIVDIPGKGKGLVATRAIQQYEEILVDYATVMVDIKFPMEVQADLGYRLLHAAVDQLSDPASVLELDQRNGYAQDNVENILRTNSFHTPLGGVPHIALYPTVSVSQDFSPSSSAVR